MALHVLFYGFHYLGSAVACHFSFFNRKTFGKRFEYVDWTLFDNLFENLLGSLFDLFFLLGNFFNLAGGTSRRFGEPAGAAEMNRPCQLERTPLARRHNW